MISDSSRLTWLDNLMHVPPHILPIQGIFFEYFPPKGHNAPKAEFLESSIAQVPDRFN
jgi:hypothetical protein